MAVEHQERQALAPEGLTAADLLISEHDNDSLVVRLHMTPNHISRWLTPIMNMNALLRSVRRGEPSVMQLLQELRDEELLTYARLHAIANSINPDLDNIRDPRLDSPQNDSSPLRVLAEFRRLRQSTCALLRALPDDAWARVGTSRTEHDWQVRTLAEHLANNDLRVLYEIDVALHRAGLREQTNTVSGAHLETLLRTYPVRAKGR